MTLSIIQNFKSAFKSEIDLAAIDSGILSTLMAALGKSESTENIGQRFGKWKILSLKYHKPDSKEPYFLLRCECGKIQALSRSVIKSRKSKSCGCE